jgi:hypothetical protein
MMRKPEPEFVRHFVLQLLDAGGKKLDNAAALGADHVVVMLVVEMMLVIGLVVTEPHLAGESGLRQELQGAINRGVPDGRVFAMD